MPDASRISFALSETPGARFFWRPTTWYWLTAYAIAWHSSWMLFLSCLTVSSGSTGGGLKMFRNLILGKQTAREVQRVLHPAAVVPLRIGGHPVSATIAGSVLAFIFIYFCTVAALTMALLLSGLDFDSAISAIIACINNAGPGLNEVGPARSYAGLTDFQKWVCALAMLAGRIEILTLLVLFSPAFWRK